MIDTDYFIDWCHIRWFQLSWLIDTRPLPGCVLATLVASIEYAILHIHIIACCLLPRYFDATCCQYWLRLSLRDTPLITSLSAGYNSFTPLMIHTLRHYASSLRPFHCYYYASWLLLAIVARFFSLMPLLLAVLLPLLIILLYYYYIIGHFVILHCWYWLFTLAITSAIFIVPLTPMLPLCRHYIDTYAITTIITTLPHYFTYITDAIDITIDILIYCADIVTHTLATDIINITTPYFFIFATLRQFFFSFLIIRHCHYYGH